MQYREQFAMLTDLTVEDTPERYDLCGAHADRTRPPRGWSLDDDRSEDGPVVPLHQGPRSVDDTVAILAAALHDQAPATLSPEPEDSQLDTLLDDVLEAEVDAELDPPPAVTPSRSPEAGEASQLDVVAAVHMTPAPPVRSWTVPAASNDDRR